MSFTRYQDYDDRGVQWVGKMPRHWKVASLRHSLSGIFNGLTAEQVDSSESTVPVTRIETISTGVINWEKLGFVSRTDSRADRRLKFGDICFSNINSLSMIGNCAIYTEDRELYGGMNLLVLRPSANIIPLYLYWVVKSDGFRQVVESLAKPAINQASISQSSLLSIGLPIPSVLEQAAIVSFLILETSKIDALVAEQKLLIELLKEKRQAVISRSVTKGLNPNVPMKDSGVEWLGKVPAHWEVVPLKWLTQPDRPIMYGIVLPGPDVGVGVPILKGGNVRPSRLRLDALARTTPEIEAPYARARLRQGDLVYSIRGTIGDCELVPIELDGCNITQDVARIAPAEEIDAEWLRFALLSDAVAEDLACGSLGAAVRGINIYDLKRAMLPVPPKIERNEIARAINAAVKEFETLMEAADLAMTLLRERRSALISAAVTGKIDVRGLVPPPEA